jgi:gliding motility-associated lipoprotein GldD
MLKIRNIHYAVFLIILVSGFSCREISVPKPRGYFRISLPEKKYLKYDAICPFVFEYPSYSKISYDVGNKNEPCWFNIEFPGYNAKIYITYKEVNNNFEAIMEDSYKLDVKNHTIKADAINETPWQNNEGKVYGILYDLKGNTASAVQFYVTDSIKHFLRGSLYFAVQPNKDSLAPVIDFFRADILHMIETFNWKEN